MMLSAQWEYLLKNLGQWEGSFTRFSPQGELIEDTPTIVTLEGQNDNTQIHQVVRRLPSGQPPSDLVLDYSSLNRSILFFEDGAFSQGSIQWGPFSDFGAEFGFIVGDRRLRLVILFNRDSNFERVTLIREKLAGSNTPEKPVLTVEQLLGEWQGEAITIYPDFNPSNTHSTHLQIHRRDRDRIEQKLSFGNRTITSTAIVEGSILNFSDSQPPRQILLLPDGASCNCPMKILPRQSFFLETGWLTSSHQRQRMIRNYGEKGEWLSLTLVKEEKIN